MDIHENSIRELVAAYNQTNNTYRILHKMLLKLGVVKEELILPEMKTVKLIPPDFIVKTCERVFGFNAKDPGQRSAASSGRHATVYFLDKYTLLSLREQASCVGRVDHTTAINSKRSCINWMDTNPEYKAKVDQVEAELIDYMKRNQIR